jgi:predicted component of type VI protein secretion system
MTEVEKTVMFAMPNLLSGQIACIAGTVAGRSWELSAGTFTIGRLDEHDLCLSQEPGVSKTHAKIIGQGDRYVLVDCESRNGTILNGANVQRADLCDGDEIRICGCVFRFAQSGGPTRPRKTTSERSSVDAAPSLAPGSFPPAVAAPAPVAEPTVAESTVAAWLPPSETGLAAPPAAPVGRILATWYAAGFVSSVVLGGAAVAVMLAFAPAEPSVPPPGTDALSTTTPSPPSSSTASTSTASAASSASTDAGTAGEAGTPTAAVDAGGVAAGTASPGAPASLAGHAPASEPNAEQAPPAAADASKNASGDAPGAGRNATYKAVVDGGGTDTIRTKTGGRVANVEVTDGAVVKRGQTLVTFSSGGDPGEVQTLRDRIASLQNAEDEDDRRSLEAAKARLAGLLGAAPVVATSDGRVSGFSVTVGAVLRPGEVLGTIGGEDEPTRVRVTVPQEVQVNRGQDATLVLKSGGSAVGRVVSRSGTSVVVDTGTVAADAVDGVRF